MKKQTLFGLIICFLNSCSPPCDECKQGENPFQDMSMSFLDNYNKRPMFPVDSLRNYSRYTFNRNNLKIKDAKGLDYPITIIKGESEYFFRIFPVISQNEIDKIYAADGLDKTFYINYDNKDIDTLSVFVKATTTRCCPEITEQKFVFNGKFNVDVNNKYSITLRKN